MSCLCDFSINTELIAHILGHVEKNPNGMYSEAELRKISREGFEALCGCGLLVFKTKLKELDSYYSNLLGDGDTDRIIQKDGEQYYAVAVGVDRIPLMESDLIYWRFDPRAFAKMIKEKNGLSSDSEVISKRILYVGTESVNNAAVYLCLFSNDKSAARELVALDIGNHSSAVFLCPTFNITQKTISSLKINAKAIVLAGAFDDDWKLRLGVQRKKKASSNKYGYKSDHVLTFLDEKGPYRSYYVQIDNREKFRIPYSKYALLLFMAIKLKDDQVGWVTQTETDKEGITDHLNINHLRSVISELRELFRGQVKDPDVFIETNKGRGTVRLSIPATNIKQPSDTRWMKRVFKTVIMALKTSRNRKVS